jgi:DNA-binding FadR family transcriptional regulator
LTVRKAAAGGASLDEGRVPYDTSRHIAGPEPPAGDAARRRRPRLKAIALSALRGPRVFEKIVAHVRDAILSGRLKPGDRLPPERELVRQFRVGRGAIREAFRILEESALIRIRPGKGGGAFVGTTTTAAVTRSLSDLLRFGGISVAQITEARLALEGLIIGTVAREAGPAELARLSESVERAAHLFEEGRRAEETEENFNFHVCLAEATRNPVYALLIRSVVDIMEPIVLRAGVSDALTRHTLQAHRTIVGHLVRRRPAAAKRALSRHLLEIHARVCGADADRHPTPRASLGA